MGPIAMSAVLVDEDPARRGEVAQAVMEEASGGRMHHMFNRVGGLKEDVPAGWLGRVGSAVTAVMLCSASVMGCGRRHW